MWAKEKPKDPEPVRGEDVQAVAFEKGEIFAWTLNGRSYIRSISFDPSVSRPYIMYRKNWLLDDMLSLFVFFSMYIIPIPYLFYKIFIRREKYWELRSCDRYLRPWNELVVRDPDQLREYSLVGIRQNIPAPIAVGL